MPKYIKCDYCGEEAHKSEITYVEGRPYCEDCVSEAEIYADTDVMDDDEDYDDVY
jgi:formylmethanofuran dehydrogenase subunit E